MMSVNDNNDDDGVKADDSSSADSMPTNPGEVEFYKHLQVTSRTTFSKYI
jgi:hypothetical protein